MHDPDQRRYQRLFRLRPWSASNVDREVEDEIESHLQMRTAELVARGLTPEAAREVTVGGWTRAGLIVAAVATLLIWVPPLATVSIDLAREAAQALL